MRISFRRRPSARRRRQAATASLLTMTALAPAVGSALQFTLAPEANLDLSSLGRIGMAGDFNGISLYQYEEQNENPVSRNGSESLLARLPNGAFATLASTDASIHDMCASYLDSGEMAGVVIAGNFTSVDGTQSQGVALFNTTSSEFVPLVGLSGQVNALLCDGDTNRVYVGGSFRHVNSTNALMWVHGQGWTPLPFAGFNGPVFSITKSSNNHIIFGGSFTGLGNLTSPQNSEGQVINLSSANITSASSTSADGFSDPRNIVCKTQGSDGPGNTWLLQDNTPGFWEATFGFGFEPTKLRLWNTRQDGRGTRTWRFTAFPINGILNMTYVDPDSGQNASCTNQCPLSNNPDVPFQDFHFVNSVGMNSFRIDISEWDGDGGGLNGVQLFTEDISAYAVNDFNEPRCEGIGLDTPSTATATGPWTESPSLESNSRYLTAQLSGDISEASASVTFFPNIAESGNYTVEMYTPGCLQDDTCASRGQINITGAMTSSPDGQFTTSLFQTNNFDKYDQIYFGFVEGSSASGFRPSITLTPLSGQSLENMTIVAQRVGFTLLNSTGGLNGLFDFDPSVTTIDKNDFSSSAINSLGAGFSFNSAVHALTTIDDMVVIAGNFTSSEARNVVGINTATQSIRPLDGGLNGEVRSMLLQQPLLYVGGSFDNTLDGNATGLDNIAAYNSNDDAWSPLGAGVNGKVLHVVPMQLSLADESSEVAITFTGNFDQINEFGDNPAVSVSGFAVWVPSQQNWLQNLDGPVPAYNGILTAAVLELPDDEGSLFAGSMTSASISANGAVTLDEQLGQFPVRIQPPKAQSSLARRDLLSQGDVSGVVTGAFYIEEDRNMTVLAGHFTARTTNGTDIHNLVFIDGNDNDAVSGLGSDLPENATFVALAIHNGRLFAGGAVSAQVNGNQVSGLVTYDLMNGTIDNQIPGLNGGNATVSAIQVRPDTGEVYVAGTFESAGSLDCPGLCYYNTELSQWNRPGTGLQGTISTLLWTSNSRLIAGGDMRANDTSVALALYNAEDQTWAPFPGQDELPGPVSVMTRGSQNGDQIWVSGTASNGSVYLMKYDGSVWLAAGETLAPGTLIYSLQMFTVTSSHQGSDMLEGDQVLMLTGSIGIPGFGTASAAIFNGTDFEPYALTTKAGNEVGTISGIFTQNSNFFTSVGGNMAVGFVVLIGLAIALGLMFLLVIAGLLLDRIRKKREGYTPAPTSMYDRGSGLRRIPPQELLESLQKGRPGAPQI